MPSIQEVKAVIRRASVKEPTATPEVLSGYSGSRLLSLLQRMTHLYKDEDACYLEVGVFRGLTLLSVSLANPDVPCYGIDNFAFFDPKDKNFNLVRERARVLEIDNYSIINEDYEVAFSELKEHLQGLQIGVYFVDGPHDYRSQLMCLHLAKPYLHPGAVVIIDDSNYQHVRQANCDFLTVCPEFKLAFEAYTPAHPKNLSSEKCSQARAGWWNGVNVLVRDAEDTLPQRYPPTVKDRTLYLNEHHIHAAKYAELAPQLLNALADLSNIRIPQALRKIGGVLRRMITGYSRNRYSTMNTYSDDLPESHLTESSK